MLHRAQQHPELLDRLVRDGRADVLEYAPVTSQHVDEGMTVAALCRAAVEVSDSTAANLLTGLAGGPRGVTRFVRALGDPVTRLDRTEPMVNAASGDLDTTTPSRMAADLRSLALGADPGRSGRDLLVSSLRASTTGDRAVRAGLPPGWDVGARPAAVTPVRSTTSPPRGPRAASRWSSPCSPGPTTRTTTPGTRPSPSPRRSPPRPSGPSRDRSGAQPPRTTMPLVM